MARDDIRFYHWRDGAYEQGISNECWTVTFAWRMPEPDAHIAFAVARCSSSDNFSRRRGRTIAAGRLICPREKTATKHTYILTEWDKDGMQDELFLATARLNLHPEALDNFLYVVKEELERINNPSPNAKVAVISE